MKKTPIRRGVSLVLTLALTLSMGLTARAAENDGLCAHHPSHTADCGYEESGECAHVCTAESGCVTVSCAHTHVGTCHDAEGKLICTHACTENPDCYTPVIRCLHTEHGSCGHNEGQQCDFAVNGCADCENPVITLKGTDVVLTDGTEYTYTGQEIRPQVTVMVDRVVLVEGQQYTVSYANNIGVGTGTVTVTAMEGSGYEGAVTLPFTIAMAPGTPEYTLVEIKGTDVTIAGTEFPYTGGAVEPQITVTVGGTELTAGRDYSVAYENNVEPGTGRVTVRGIATASQTLGYTGEVTIEFTILPAQTPDEDKPGEEDKPGAGETPGEDKPGDSEPPDEEKPGDDASGEEEKPSYKITKGSGSKWSQGSSKNLSFTVNADTDDITEIRIDNKKLASSHYTLGEDGLITLKNSWLKKLAMGTYGITVVFEDGEARGNFRVIAEADPSNPETGDSIGLWMALMMLSMAGTAVLLIPGVRKKLR